MVNAHAPGNGIWLDSANIPIGDTAIQQSSLSHFPDIEHARKRISDVPLASQREMKKRIHIVIGDQENRTKPLARFSGNPRFP